MLQRLALIFLILSMSPLVAFAQATLKSSNFELDSINFGSNFTLTTSANNPPNISAEGPTVSELEATRVVVTWKTDRKSTSFVKHGTSTDNYGQQTGTTDLVTNHTVTLVGLTPETKYFYRAISTDAFGAEAESEDKTFITPAEQGITTIKVTDVGYNKALITWKTGSFTHSKIEYGTTTSYGQVKEVASRSFVTDHTVQLTDLKPGTEYHLRVVAEDEKGRINKSSDFTFTTIAEPKFESISANVLTPNSAEINWKTNTPASGVITYRKEGEDEKSAGISNRLISQTLVLTSLIGNSDYTFRITATDEQGKQVVSEPQTFKTLIDTSPPKIEDLKVKVSRSGNDLVLTATWKTDELSSSEGVLTPRGGATQEIAPQGNNTTNHILVKTGVSPSETYNFKAVSTDPFGNRADAQISFISPSSRKSIVELILERISAAFGWVGNVFK